MATKKGNKRQDSENEDLDVSMTGKATGSPVKIDYDRYNEEFGNHSSGKFYENLFINRGR